MKKLRLNIFYKIIITLIVTPLTIWLGGLFFWCVSKLFMLITGYQFLFEPGGDNEYFYTVVSGVAVIFLPLAVLVVLVVFFMIVNEIFS